MKAVKFVFCGIYEVKPSLTYGKIYDVLNYRINNNSDRPIITIKNDLGNELEYFMISEIDVWFEDATPYIREEKLNQLLNE